MFKQKNILLMSILLLFLFLTASGVSAVEDNVTDESNQDLAVDEVMAEDSVDETLSLENDGNDNLEDDSEGYVDASDAYEYLNEFRSEKGAWFWASNNVRIVYFNTHEDNQLQPLIRDAELEETAKIRAKECAELYSHTRPDGTDCFTAYPDRFWMQGENLAPAFTAKDATEAWKEDFLPCEDQGHRQNMLNPTFTHVGIAGYRASDGTIYWVQSFGAIDVEIPQKNQTPWDASKGTFDELNRLIEENVEISLQKDYAYYNDSSFRNGIVINKSVVIDGCGHEIDALKFARIFDISADDVLLKNIRFTNAYIDYVYGGAIYSSGNNLTVINCSFTSNFAYYGSCIACDGDYATLLDCTFADNYGVEGSVYSNNCDVNLKNCSFMDNEVILYAAGIASGNGNVAIDECRFINNSGYKSGAVSLLNGRASFRNCSFIENGALLEGGAISLNNVIAGFEDCNFTANALNCDYYAFGGAIYSTGSDMTFNECNFIDNVAFSPRYSANGGALYAIDGNASFSECNLNGNEACVFGAALCLINSNDTIANCSFGKNSLTSKAYSTHGGAIYFEESEISVGECSFTDNYGGYGASISSSGCKLNIEDCNFIANAADFHGGAICCDGDDVTINDCRFENSFCGFDGGALSLTKCDVNINDCNFMNSTAEYGGAVYCIDSNISCMACDFINNSAVSDYDVANGGAIFSSGSNVSCLNSKFTDNLANSETYVTRGGAIYSLEGNVNLLDCGFVNNNAIFGMAIFSTKGNVSVRCSSFVDDGLDEGSAIYSYIGNVFIEGSEFAGFISDNGAALYLSEGDVSVKNASFTNNLAKSTGGAISFDYCNVSLTDSIFVDNSAVDGGSIFSNNGDITLKNCSFKNGIAKSNGGALSIYSGNFIIEECSFENNYINSDYYYANGGAACLINANGNISGSSFSGNSVNATYNAYGGALHLSDGAVSLENCRFDENNALQGGAVYSTAGNLKVSDCSFADNSALEGGALTLSDGNISIVKSQFINNSANWGGGALFMDNGNGTVEDCIFSNNTASPENWGRGGAVLSNYGNATLLNSNFTNNAAYDGGAAYSCDAVGCTFIENHADNAGGAMHGTPNSADNCRFIKNVAYHGGPTYEIAATECTFIENRLITKAQFDIEYLESTYRQYDFLPVYLYAGYYDYISNATVTVRAYKNNDLADTSYFLSGDGWIVNITEGEYTFALSVENQDFEVEPVNVTLTILKKEIADLTVNIENKTYPDTITADITSNVDGNVDVYLDDAYCDYINVVANQSMQLPFNYVHAGNHTLKFVIMPADFNIDQKTFIKNFTVFKKETSVALEVEDTTDTENAVVNVIASDNGNVKVRIGSLVQNSYVYADEKMPLYFGVLQSGAYEVTAVFSVDENYIDSNTSKTFKVFSKLSEEDIIVTPPKDDLKEVIITLPDDAGGKIIFAVAGEDYESDVVGGVAAVKLHDLADGIYPYYFEYSGDGKYLGLNFTGSLNTAPYKKSVTIDVGSLESEYFLGDILHLSLRTPEQEYITNATVTLRAYNGNALAGTFDFVCGDGWTVNITEGEYVFEFSVEKQNYVAQSVNATIMVLKKIIADVNVDVADNVYSEPTAADITSSVDGAITVDIDNTFFKNDNVAANKASRITFEDIPAGTHTLTVTIVPANPKIDSRTFKKEFEVFKKQTSIALDVEDGVNTENVIVNVTASQDGSVKITAGNLIKDVNVKANVKTQVDLGILNKGSYVVSAVFSAGENYIDSNASKALRLSAKLSQDDIRITPPKENSSDIAITLPVDATGKVTLSIAGESYEVDVVGGVANVKLPDLAGDNPYTITYSGDGNYAGFSFSGTLNGDGQDKNITIKPDMQITPFENGTCRVTLPGDAKGTVTLTINGQSHDFDVQNGIATVRLPELDDGNYAYAISYSGDAKYSSASQSGSVEIVNPVDAIITAGNVKATYSSGSYYQISLVNAYSGKPLGGKSVTVKVNGKTYKTLTTNDGGICSFKIDQVPGTYKLTISALDKSVGRTLTVKHLLSLKKVTVKRSAKKLVLTASLAKVNGKYLSSKKVTFKFNGKKYTAKTNKKGVAKVTVKSNVLKKLKAGKKVTCQATYLKDTIKYTVKVKK